MGAAAASNAAPRAQTKSGSSGMITGQPKRVTTASASSGKVGAEPIRRTRSGVVPGAVQRWRARTISAEWGTGQLEDIVGMQCHVVLFDLACAGSFDVDA